ncbi:dethiobiotin synthase [Parashewanella spongiae]|uniref:ATP-dependent dethiobiotin synthetase BioD n=1 Tax=Parashewanella spongiae TaxID=342950 RepID=A0A3A6U207_9GAMM|nr:dethiobiotin synthase [Parashewanella spongiae]MCL1076721.1 dethiobiotin synthase [Parashewanella spongiae]RJY19465.1 dethiobiotin synthase [Parashewanella spongiae]
MNYFVTGTDTDSGKTVVSSGILMAVNRWAKIHNKSMKTAGFKPIASGCEQTCNGLRNSDALSLMAASSQEIDYSIVNPISFEPAIAPHVAAKQIGFELTSERVLGHLSTDVFSESDFNLLEGAGGWRLPLNNEEFLSEVIQKLDLPVILVVGLKLGCLNHGVLTQEAILSDGLNIVGWVANCVDKNMQAQQDNLTSLNVMMKSPCLGVVPYLNKPTADNAADYLDVSHLLNC